jgi:hypothetical protein
MGMDTSTAYSRHQLYSHRPSRQASYPPSPSTSCSHQLDPCFSFSHHPVSPTMGQPWPSTARSHQAAPSEHRAGPRAYQVNPCGLK